MTKTLCWLWPTQFLVSVKSSFCNNDYLIARIN